MNLTTLYTKVLYILAQYPDTRNSDIELTTKIWEIYYPSSVKDGYVNIKELFELPREDHISRVRRKIQNDEKLYPPTEEKIAMKRGWLEAEWKKALGYYVMSDDQIELSI